MLSIVNHLSGLNHRIGRQTVYHVLSELMLTIMFVQANKQKRGDIFKRAESYVKEYRDAEREKIRLSRLAKQEGSFYVPAEAKLAFVVRIKGLVTSSHTFTVW